MAIEPHRKDSPFGHQCCDPQEQLRKEILLDQFFKEKPGLSNLQQAKDIDSHLGFKIPKIERKLLKKYRAYYKKSDSSNSKGFHSESETWVGLHPQVLLTPYAEIHRFLTFLKSYDPKIVVDLGAAYRRIGIVMSNILPTAQFKGFEIVTERLEEAKRVYASLLLENCQIEHQNILDDSFEIPDADIYFIYDFILSIYLLSISSHDMGFRWFVCKFWK